MDLRRRRAGAGLQLGEGIEPACIIFAILTDCGLEATSEPRFARFALKEVRVGAAELARHIRFDRHLVEREESSPENVRAEGLRAHSHK